MARLNRYVSMKYYRLVRNNQFRKFNYYDHGGYFRREVANCSHLSLYISAPATGTGRAFSPPWERMHTDCSVNLQRQCTHHITNHESTSLQLIFSVRSFVVMVGSVTRLWLDFNSNNCRQLKFSLTSYIYAKLRDVSDQNIPCFSFLQL